MTCCKSCHYDLRTITAGRCPECGSAFDVNDAGTFISSLSAHRRTQQTICILIPIVAAVASWKLMTLYPFLVSSLPRPMQGESVIVPWPACLAGQLVVPVVLPWIISLLLLRNRWHRVSLLLCLVAFTLLWHTQLDLHALLDKAYRRGL